MKTSSLPFIILALVGLLIPFKNTSAQPKENLQFKIAEISEFEVDAKTGLHTLVKRETTEGIIEFNSNNIFIHSCAGRVDWMLFTQSSELEDVSGDHLYHCMSRAIAYTVRRAADNSRVTVSGNDMVIDYALWGSDEEIEIVEPEVVEEVVEVPVFVVVEEMPDFIYKGEKIDSGSFHEYLADSLRWPDVEGDFAGSVFVNFTVEKDGSLSDFKILRGIHADIDAEAVRVIRSMPNWKPGKQRGKSVRVSYTLPVRFRKD